MLAKNCFSLFCRMGASPILPQTGTAKQWIVGEADGLWSAWRYVISRFFCEWRELNCNLGASPMHGDPVLHFFRIYGILKELLKQQHKY